MPEDTPVQTNSPVAKPNVKPAAKPAANPKKKGSNLNRLMYLLGAIILVILIAAYFLFGIHNQEVTSTTSIASTVSSTVASSSSSSSTSTILSKVNIVSNSLYNSLLTTDNNTNASKTLIVVGTGYDNKIARQVLAANPSLNTSLVPGSTIIYTIGSNVILVLGYNSTETSTAGQLFAQELMQAKTTSPGKGLVYKGVTILNVTGRPNVQVVVGQYGSQSDVSAADVIAATIKNYSILG